MRGRYGSREVREVVLTKRHTLYENQAYGFVIPKLSRRDCKSMAYITWPTNRAILSIRSIVSISAAAP